MARRAVDKTKRYIILDTCIISCFSNEDLGNKILDILREAVALGYGIAISDITLFEVINGTGLDTEVKMMETLKGVDRFSLKQDVLFAAAHLGGLYKAHDYRLDQFGTADQLIAATSITRNALVFTKNGKDFPQPMFKELDRRMIEYTSKEYPVCVPTYFMEPQIDYIRVHYSKRVEPLKRKKGRTKKSNNSK